MKTNRFLIAGCVLAASVAAWAFMSAASFDSFKSTLNKAEAISATVQVNVQGGAPSSYSISMAKPNKLRLETASQLVVADGTSVTTYLKGKNQYWSVDQTAMSLAEAMSGMEYQMWSPFFSDKAFAKVARVENKGDKRIKGEDHKVVHVEADAKGDTKMDFYLNSKSNLPTRLSIDSKTLTGTSQMILSLEDAKMTAAADLFAFNAPEGAEKVDLSVMNLGKWLYDHDEALKIASAGNKLIMVDFMADWCGPCKMMEAQVFSTDEFKKATSDMVLLKIDVDRSQALAQRYGIEAMPTVKFINGKGEIIHEFVGYGGFGQVMGEVEKAKSKFSN